MTTRELMTRAIALAKEAAAAGEVPVGAVVARGGEMIAEGRNRVEELKNPLAHAELIAIRNALECTEFRVQSSECGADVFTTGDHTGAPLPGTGHRAPGTQNTKLNIQNSTLITQHPGKYLSDCDLIVTLEPCPMCAGAIINSRIKRVVFGAFDPKAGSVFTVQEMYRLPYNHAPEVQAGFMERECAALLTEFFRKLRE